MVPYKDDQCPARDTGLSHFAEHPSYVCADCGQQCLIESAVVTDDQGLPLTVMFGEVECIVDHDALVSGHDGKHWARCVQCDTMVEMRQPPIGPQGMSWGKGRIGSPRAQAQDQAKWGFMKWHNKTVEP
jgi:hypothetical protein